MNPQRSAQVLGLSQTAVVVGLIVAWLSGFGSTGIRNTGAALIDDRRLPSLAAAVELVDVPRPTGRGLLGHGLLGHGLLATAAKPVTQATAVAEQPKPIVEPAPTASQASAPAPSVQVAAVSTADPAREAGADEPKPIVEMEAAIASPQPAAAPALQLAMASPSDQLPNDVMKPASPVEAPDACPAEDACIDRYLWAIYQRTPKEDSIKVEDQRKVTVKKRGKMVTVTRSFTRLVDEDFGWKDP